MTLVDVPTTPMMQSWSSPPSQAPKSNAGFFSLDMSEPAKADCASEVAMGQGEDLEAADQDDLPIEVLSLLCTPLKSQVDSVNFSFESKDLPTLTVGETAADLKVAPKATGTEEAIDFANTETELFVPSDEPDEPAAEQVDRPADQERGRSADVLDLGSFDAPNSESQNQHDDHRDQGQQQSFARADADFASGFEESVTVEPTLISSSSGLSAATQTQISGQSTDFSRPALSGNELPVDVAKQLAISVVHDGDGVTEIALTPDEMGTVKLHLTTTDDGVVVVISTERPETGDFLRRHLDSLAQEFRGAGYKDVSFSFSDQTPGNQNSNRQPVFATTPREVEDESVSNFLITSAHRSTGLDLRV